MFSLLLIGLSVGLRKICSTDLIETWWNGGVQAKKKKSIKFWRGLNWGHGSNNTLKPWDSWWEFSGSQSTLKNTILCYSLYCGNNYLPKSFCIVHMFIVISWHSARCCYLRCKPVLLALLALLAKHGVYVPLSGVKLKWITAQWRWWKVAPCLPTSVDKALLFSPRGKWPQSQTHTLTHTQAVTYTIRGPGMNEHI